MNEKYSFQKVQQDEIVSIFGFTNFRKSRKEKRMFKDDALPLTINNYIFLKRIGHGGSAHCYLVESLKFQTKTYFVAKVIPISETLSISAENTALIDLNHPNIIRFYDRFKFQNMYIFILEYCEKGSLAEAIIPDVGIKSTQCDPFDNQPRNLDAFNNYAYQIVDALYFCHSKKWAHRDIKPSNVLIDRYGRMKLADFGLSILFENEYEIEYLDNDEDDPDHRPVDQVVKQIYHPPTAFSPYNSSMNMPQSTSPIPPLSIPLNSTNSIPSQPFISIPPLSDSNNNNASIPIPAFRPSPSLTNWTTNDQKSKFEDKISFLPNVRVKKRKISFESQYNPLKPTRHFVPASFSSFTPANLQVPASPSPPGSPPLLKGSEFSQPQNIKANPNFSESIIRTKSLNQSPPKPASNETHPLPKPSINLTPNTSEVVTNEGEKIGRKKARKRKILCNSFCGSLVYTAPEILNKQSYDPFSADIWSLGVLFLVMLVGRSPWDGKKTEEVRSNILHANISSDVLSKIPEDLLKLINRMITINPSERLTIEEIRNDPYFDNPAISTTKQGNKKLKRLQDRNRKSHSYNSTILDELSSKTNHTSFTSIQTSPLLGCTETYSSKTLNSVMGMKLRRITSCGKKFCKSTLFSRTQSTPTTGNCKTPPLYSSSNQNSSKLSQDELSQSAQNEPEKNEQFAFNPNEIAANSHSLHTNVQEEYVQADQL